MLLKEKIKSWKIKIATGISTLLLLLGGYIVQLRSCTQTAIVVTTQAIQNPTNQIITAEATSFVANLFYEGTDDPFPTRGTGGEIGKLTHLTLKKGIHKLFPKAWKKILIKTGDIIISSRRWDSKQIQAGMRAISKKQGHAIKNVATHSSAFNGLPIKQSKAEELIEKIINGADAIVLRNKRIRVYTPDGKGLSLDTKTGEFVGFVERTLEREL